MPDSDPLLNGQVDKIFIHLLDESPLYRERSYTCSLTMLFARFQDLRILPRKLAPTY